MLTKEDGSEELVTVSREEGQISVEGDAFSAESMNDLENRIEEMDNKRVTSTEEVNEVEGEGYTVDAMAFKEFLDNIQIVETLPGDAAQHPYRIYLTFS